MSKYVKPAHKRIARCLGYALTLGEPHGWWSLSALLVMRLSRQERAALAYAALISLDEKDGFEVAEAALFFTERPAP